MAINAYSTYAVYLTNVNGFTKLQTTLNELNQQLAVNELRRMVIQDLLGQLVGGQNDVQSGPAGQFTGTDEPYVPTQPLADTDMIQFLVLDGPRGSLPVHVLVADDMDVAFSPATRAGLRAAGAAG